MHNGVALSNRCFNKPNIDRFQRGRYSSRPIPEFACVAEYGRLDCRRQGVTHHMARLSSDLERLARVSLGHPLCQTSRIWVESDVRARFERAGISVWIIHCRIRNASDADCVSPSGAGSRTLPPVRKPAGCTCCGLHNQALRLVKPG